MDRENLFLELGISELLHIDKDTVYSGEQAIEIIEREIKREYGNVNPISLLKDLINNDGYKSGVGKLEKAKLGFYEIVLTKNGEYHTGVYIRK